MPFIKEGFEGLRCDSLLAVERIRADRALQFPQILRRTRPRQLLLCFRQAERQVHVRCWCGALQRGDVALP
jgi:hypothetical protein